MERRPVQWAVQFFFPPIAPLAGSDSSLYHGLCFGLLPDRPSCSSLDFLPCLLRSLASPLDFRGFCSNSYAPPGFKALPAPCLCSGVCSGSLPCLCRFLCKGVLFKDWVVVVRGLREVSVALGPPPCLLPLPCVLSRLEALVSFSVANSFVAPELVFDWWSLPSTQGTDSSFCHCPDPGLMRLHSGPFHHWKATPFYRGRGQRETSVALGSPPASNPPQACFPTCFPLLQWGGQLAVAFFLTLAALHLLVLWRLVVLALPGGRSPLLNLLSFSCAYVPACMALSWGSVGSPGRIDKTMRGRQRPNRNNLRAPLWARLLFCFWALPTQVWAVPPEVASAITGAYAALTPDPGELSAASGGATAPNQGASHSVPVARHITASSPDDLPPPRDDSPNSPPEPQDRSPLVAASEYRASVETDIASKGASCCLQAQKGLCIISPGVKVPARVTLCPPGHRIVTTEIFLDLPASLESFLDSVYEAAPVPLDACWNKLIPAAPQLGDGAATLLVVPHWFKQAGLSATLFDARAMTGKVFAEVLPRQTSLEAIQRVAGPTVIEPFEAFIAGSLQPLQPGQIVHVEEGDTICFAPLRHLPLWGPSLSRSLQQPTPWLGMDPIPSTAKALCALVLHESGKFLFSDFAQCDWQNALRVTHFVGVEMSESRLVSAAGLASYVYHGIHVRGVIAVLGRSTARDQQNRPLPAVFFLDGRPIGQDINFCVVDRYFVSRDFLQGRVQCQPPQGHRLAVMGGQLRGNGIEFHGGEVLTLAYIPDGPLEALESEPDGSDDPSDSPHDSDPSDDSARSRSRHRGASPSQASGDSSHYGHLPSTAADDSCKYTSPAAKDALAYLQCESSALVQLVPCLHFASLVLSFPQRGSKLCTLARPPALTVKLGDAPPLHIVVGGSNQANAPAQLPNLRDIGDRSPTRWHPPDLTAVAPEFVDNPPALAPLRALFVVLCEDYRPEVIPLTFWQPVDYFLVIREVQALRLPDVRRHFPRLLAIEPQPCTQFAVLLGFPGLPGPFCDIVFDCRAVGGYVFAGHVDAQAYRSELLSIAGYAHRFDVDVWVPSVRGPLPDHHRAGLFTGSLVSLAPRGIAPPRLAPLADMLRRPDTWNARAEVPFASDPGVWLLTDEGPSFFPIPIGASRIPRSQLAATLRYDRARLFTAMPSPQIRNFCFRGVAAPAVLVASQRLLQPLDAEPSSCIVIVDLRPLQLGITWVLAARGLFSLENFADDLDYPCPTGFQLTAEGAPRIFSRPGCVLRVVDGSRITIACVPIPPGAAAQAHRFAHSDRSETDSDGYSDGIWESSSGSSRAGHEGHEGGDGNPPAGPPPPLPEPNEAPCDSTDALGALVLSLVSRATSPCGLFCVMLSASPVLSAGVALPVADAEDCDTAALSCADARACPLHHLLAVGLPVILYKLLCEPCCAGPSVDLALASLRTATRNLGVAWPFFPANLSTLLEPDLEEPDEQNAARPVRVSFAVLVPNYPPELGQADLELPCTPAEAIEAIQGARSTASYLRFPFLTPASPQSVVGYAVVLATPRWAPTTTTVLINTSEIDGRIFACHAPDYADCEILIALADLPPQGDYLIFAGDDDQPLDDGAQAHMFPGIQISFTFADQPSVVGLPFARTLLLPDAWGHDTPFPQVAIDHAYCVVHDSRFVLHIENYRNPFRFRINLARRLGVDDRRLSICHARRAPDNVAVDGVRCRTLLAACCHSPPCAGHEPEGFFLDLRPIQEGFAFMLLQGDNPDLAGLTRIFQTAAPQGWTPRFSSEHQPDGRPVFEAGSVIIVDYAPVPTLGDAPHDTHGGTQGDAEASHSGAGASHGPTDTLSAASGQEARESGRESPRNNEDDGAGQGPLDRASSINVAVPGVFLVLAQDYTTELIEAQLPVDTQPAVALLYVSQARNQRDRQRFPILCAVEPQPLGAQALLLALPLWAPDGAIAAFDLTGVDGRLFALQIGRRVTRAGLLQAAELPDDPRFDVYVGTMPWAIPPTTPVDIKHGDLVQITFAGRGPSIVSSLADMLRSDRGWNPDLTFIRAFSGWNLDDAWVLNQDRPFLLHVSAARRRYVRQDLAFRLRIPVDELILRSPQPRVVDFSHRGWVTCSVLYAAGTANGQHYAAIRDPFCFIDMRPILRGLNAVACHGGHLDLQGLYAHANARCPQGFRTQLWHGQHEVDLSSPDLQVADGAVLTAAFLPAQQHGASGAQGPPDGGSGPSPSGSPPDDGPGGGTSDTPEAPPSPDDGTGSSCSSSPADAPTHYQVATCLAGCFRDVQPPNLARQPQGLLVQDNMCKFAFASHHVLPEDKPSCTSAALAPPWHFGSACLPCRLHRSRTVLLVCLTALFLWAAYVGLRFSLAGLFSQLAAWVAVTSARRAWKLAAVYCTLVHLATSVEGMQFVVAQADYSSRGLALPDAHSAIPNCAEGRPPNSRPTPTPLRSLLSRRGPLALPSPTVGPAFSNPGSTTSEPQSPMHGDLAALDTLLEESRRESKDYPLYLASTLLDALSDHFTNKVPTLVGEKEGSPHGCPLVLSLDAAVTCEPYNLPPVPPTPLQLGPILHQLLGSVEPLMLSGTPLGFTREQISLFLQPAVRFGTLRDLLESLPPRQARSLSSLVSIAGNEHGLLCYVDGSFTPATNLEDALLGWACVFIDAALSCISIVSGPAPPWFLDLCAAPSAFVAECIALTAATWVGCTAFHGRSALFLSDCQSAIKVAGGEVSSYTSDVALVLRRTAACFETLQGRPLTFEYVPGHQGLFGNEAADAAAKLASKGRPVGQLVWNETGGSCPIDWWSQGAPRVEWCGVAARAIIGDPTMPPLGSALGVTRDDLDMTPQQMLAPFCTQQPAAAPAGNAGEGTLAFCIATYNVLSLSGRAFEDRDPTGLAFSAGRPALLAAGLDKAGIQVAAIQEARTEAGFLRTSGFLRFSSGGEVGCFGVELWFKEAFPVLCDGKTGNPVATFCREAFSTAYSDSRRLILHFHSGPLRLCFASLHAPHRGTEADKLHDWWERTITLLRHAATRAPIVLGGDFNAAVGSQCCCRVGDCWPEEQDTAGAFLVELVSACQCWLPSTWGHLHSGQSWTYMQKRNNALQRPDFVGLPDCWENARVSSWVDPEIHAGQPYIDHLAAAVSVSARLRLDGSRPGTRKPVRIDAHALVDRNNRLKLQAIVDKAPRAPWQVSADAHAAQLVGYLQGALVEAFPKPKQRKRRSYLTDDTWALYAQVAALRHRCARLRAHSQYHLLAAAFRAWSTRGVDDFESALVSPWALEASFQGHRHRDALRGLSKQLKHACRTDRARYLSSLADEVQANTPGSYQALNRLLSLKQKKPFTPEVLPEVLDADGQVCETPAEATQRWRTYFGDMESGVQKDAEGVHQVAAARHGLAWPSPDDITEVPGPAELCKAMAHTQLHKASGPDGIPGEAFKALPAALTSLVLPLVLKLGLLGEEGAGLKGALLTWLYKFKGARNLCTSYRAIMLLPTLTKVIHRSFRPRLYEHVVTHAPPLLLGGRKGASAVFGSHLTRAFAQWCSEHKQPACILYADVASAYYNSVRDLTAQRVDVDGCPVDSLAAAQLPADANVADTRASGSAFRARGASPWLESLAAEMHRGSWFALRGDHVPVVTHRGSRPGSSLADIMYSAGVGRITAKRDSLRAADPNAGHVPRIPWDGRRDISSTEPPTQWISLSDVIWADDLAACFLLSDSARAAHQVGLEASFLDEAFGSHGYLLTYGTSKTAAMVLLGGRGSKAAKRTLFSRAGAITVLREHHQAASLPLVAQYKHLGVIVGASFLTELRARCASAWAAFRQGRVRAYRCRRISVARRGALLRAMVLPRLLFGAGAWPSLRQGERALFHRTLVSMYRQTLCIPRNEDQHITGATMCALLHLPDPVTVLRVERLRYLRQLVQAAPDALWALVRSSPSFLATTRDAMEWLYRRLSATIPLGDPAHDWPAWAEVMCRTPGRFRGWIKRAAALEVLRLTAHAAMQACHRFLSHFCSSEDAAFCPERRRPTEACIPCRKAFADRVSWACHASKLHGYRTRATETTRGSQQAWCRGCGKIFANANRMKRHVFVTPACQVAWGSFVPDEGASLSPLHPSAPPLRLPGRFVPVDLPADTEEPNCHPGLVDALLELTGDDESTAWEVVAGFVAPLEHLRCSVRAWRAHARAQPFASEVATNLLLLLDPELCCDSFPQSRPKPAVVDFLAPFPPLRGLVLPVAQVGTLTFWDIDSPPLPSFVSPFDGSAPLAAASRHVAWLEATTDVVLQAVQMSLSHPVCIRAPPAALRCLEPLTSWLRDGGFLLTAGGIASVLR